MVRLARDRPPGALCGLHDSGVVAAVSDFVRERCRQWGREMRWTFAGKDGWPPRTMLDKMIKEGILGASSSLIAQVWPEFLSEIATETNIAIKRLPEVDREMIFVQFVVADKAKVKAARMQIHIRTYYARLDTSLTRLSGILCVAHNSPISASLSDPEYATLGAV